MNSYLPVTIGIFLAWSLFWILLIELICVLWGFVKTRSWIKTNAIVNEINRIGKKVEDRTLRGEKIVVERYHRIKCLVSYSFRGEQFEGRRFNLANFGIFVQNYDGEQYNKVCNIFYKEKELDISVNPNDPSESVIFTCFPRFYRWYMSIAIIIALGLIAAGWLGLLKSGAYEPSSLIGEEILVGSLAVGGIAALAIKASIGE